MTMTEQEFITQYVAPLGAMIEESVDRYHRTKEETIGVCIARAKESWAILQQQLGEQQEPDEEDVYDEHISREKIQNDNIYVGIPEEEGASFRKVIFCPCGAFDGGVYVRFALFEERGDYKLMVKDNAAHHAVSYSSDKCVCMAKDIVGVNFDALPEMWFRRPGKGEKEFLGELFASAELSIAEDASSMYLRERMIN